VCSALQKDEKRENMKKKIITGLIALAAIVAVAIFAGCIEEDTSPTAKASASPPMVNVGEKVSFSALGSADPDGNITSYEWNFGDGTITSGATVSHTYPTKGIYTVMLTVIDNDGLSDTTEVDVTVVLDTIKIDITSSTWREGERPYDIYSSIEKNLKKAGFRIVPKESSAYNATLFINYREEKDGEYYEEFGSGDFMGYGTNIKCNIQLNHEKFGLLFKKELFASTPFSAYNLYQDAVQNFENKVYFKYLGEIIASKYGAGSEVSVLISALINDKSSDTRADAAEVLGEIGDARAVEPLIDALRDVDYTVQWDAAEALGKIGDKRAVEPLITTLKAEDGYLQDLAAEALGEIGDAEAVEPLIGALKDEEGDVRSSAAGALGKIGDKRAVEPLIITLKDEDEFVRGCAADALGEIGDKRAIEPLTAALKDEDEFVRSRAETALEKIRGF
jgi:PKD repeat protein